VRTSGAVDHVGGLGSSGHVCWAYDDVRQFARPALQWLGDGVELGQRLIYVSGRPLDRMRRDVAALPGVEDLLERSALQLVCLPDVYDLDAPLVAEEQLATYSAATEQALADGYTGLRVLADVSDLVRDPARRPAHVRWEHLADEFMSANPLAAMCAYQRDLGDDAIRELAAVHPVVHAPPELVPFQLFFDDGRLVLAGTVDTFSSDLLARLLADSHLTDATVTLDVARLEFIDARGVTTLAEWAGNLRRRAGTLHLEGASPLLRRIWSVLRLDAIAGISLTTGSA
jgi:anti-anti-sigma regulatory factor